MFHAPRLWPASAGFTLSLALLTPAASAQTTGNVQGTITDTEGRALPSVTVEAKSSSLQGVRTATTGNVGEYRLPHLPPGTYQVRASLPGFATAEKTAYVTLDSTATVDLSLQVSAEEKVIVTGEAPLVDLASTTTGSTFTAEVLARMSVGRNYADIVKSQPGVNTDTALTHGRAAPLTVYGSTSIENLYLIDGVNTNNVAYGFQGKFINPESMQEVEIKTGGYQAEYGRAMGGVINVITKSGGNEFHGDAFGYFNSKEMRAEAEITDGDIVSAEKTEVDRWDAGAALGGYILKDRLWFFASYDRIEEDTIRIPQGGPVAGQGFLLASESDISSGKLTWNISSGSSLVATAFADPEKRSGAVNLPASMAPATYTADRYLGARDYAGRFTQLFGSLGILTLQYSRHNDRFQTKIPPDAEEPNFQDRTVPGVTAVFGGFGNIGRPANAQSHRDGYAGSFTAYLGNHELKMGGDYEDNSTFGVNRRTGAEFIRILPCRANPNNPALPDRCARAGGTGTPYVNFRGEAVPAGVFFEHNYLGNPDGSPVFRIPVETPSLAYSAFIQDNFRISRRLTANAGIRWDQEKIQNSEQQTVIDLKDMWSPRAGFVWDFLGDGTAKAFVSYGRFYYQFPTSLNQAAYGPTHFLFVLSYNYDPASLEQDPLAPFPGSATTAFGDEPRDENLKGMYQDEFTVGVEKALTPTFVVGLKGNYHTLDRVLEDRCDLDYEHPENRGFACAIVNPGSSGRYASGDFPCHNANRRPEGEADDTICNENGGPPLVEASRIYRGIELVAKKGFSERLWTQASYIYSSLRGNYDGAASLRTGQTLPGLNADFDYAQFDRTRSHGKLYLDRPHSFQVGATYAAPFGLTAGVSAYVRSGPPINKMEFFNQFYDQFIFGVRRGTAGRVTTEYEANLSLAYELKMRDVTITPRLYVFNLLNRQGEIRVEEAFNPDGAFDPSGNAVRHVDYGKVRQRQEPRLFRVAMRVSF